MKKDWLTIRNDDTDTAEMSIMGYIGTGKDEQSHAAFKSVLDHLKAKGVKNCKMTINSGGGDMVEGLAIYDDARASGIKFDVRVIGMAASMGSILMLIGDKMPIVSPSAMIMFHKPQMDAAGEADALRDMADLGDKFEDRIKDILTTRTGNDKAVVDSWFNAGRMKWMDAKEAIANKVARNDDSGEAASYQAPVPVENITPDMTEEQVYKIYNSFSNNNKNDMKLSAQLLAVLAITASATDVEIENAITAKLKEKDDALTALQNKVTIELKAQAKNQVDALIKNKAATEGEREELEAAYVASPATTAKLFAKMVPANLPKDKLKVENREEGDKEDDEDGAVDKSKWTTLDYAKNGQQDELDNIKATDRELYNKICKRSGVKAEY